MSSPAPSHDGGLAIAVLNQVVGCIEEHLTEEIDVAGLTSVLATTEYHVRRMFSSLVFWERRVNGIP
jgi:AraC-like DNA-binding protein